ncbi:hypothetical protein LEP1GSC193_3124 [Leptospira alstonii serovar Pingchang str. 80-412]|uniref:Uncharacterized protein n=2 Tax=Leptospira alstonii TaxID=28452 RepID=M6CH71_9LEPT|nr:hypothetical protein LEP1GSC194_0078 [Leptospira alstonii serovar Sichuan str. 79601]EQA80775.1 hypothetical protein LEP1GSC193_3124 [Leptospira alstonii serovar Pingchang str. 80-412]
MNNQTLSTIHFWKRFLNSKNRKNASYHSLLQREMIHSP